MNEKDWDRYFIERRKKTKGAYSLKDSLSEIMAEEDPDGVSLGDRMVIAYMKDRLENPERISLKEISSALGEAKQNLDVTSGGEPLDFFAPPKARGGGE